MCAPVLKINVTSQSHFSLGLSPLFSAFGQFSMRSMQSSTYRICLPLQVSFHSSCLMCTCTQSEVNNSVVLLLLLISIQWYFSLGACCVILLTKFCPHSESFKISFKKDFVLYIWHFVIKWSTTVVNLSIESQCRITLLLLISADFSMCLYVLCVCLTCLWPKNNSYLLCF